MGWTTGATIRVRSWTNRASSRFHTTLNGAQARRAALGERAPARRERRRAVGGRRAHGHVMSSGRLADRRLSSCEPAQSPAVASASRMWCPVYDMNTSSRLAGQVTDRMGTVQAGEEPGDELLAGGDQKVTAPSTIRPDPKRSASSTMAA